MCKTLLLNTSENMILIRIEDIVVAEYRDGQVALCMSSGAQIKYNADYTGTEEEKRASFKKQFEEFFSNEDAYGGTTEL